MFNVKTTAVNCDLQSIAAVMPSFTESFNHEGPCLQLCAAAELLDECTGEAAACPNSGDSVVHVLVFVLRF